MSQTWTYACVRYVLMFSSSMDNCDLEGALNNLSPLSMSTKLNLHPYQIAAEGLKGLVLSGITEQSNKIVILFI